MKTVERVCKALLVFAGVSVCAGLFVCAEAQVAENAVISGQRQVQPRITEAIDASKLVTLKGNVHPMARPEFDQGPVSDAQPMQRMMLLLQRSPEQEAALQRLLQEQQTKDSPNFHKWLT